MLHQRRLQGDIIETYKLLHGIEDTYRQPEAYVSKYVQATEQEDTTSQN